MSAALAGQAGMGAGGALLAALLLGLLHGLVPDEHTWPITLSYALGSVSGRRGLKAGLLFSAAFTAQRALAAELSYLALAPVLASGRFNALVDLVVGLVMAGSGLYILARGRELHLTEGLERRLHRLLCVRGCGKGHGVAPSGGSPVPLRLTLVHGFVAGWGTGPFAVALYTLLAPAMGSPALAFLPGILFGLGTMAMQGLFGAIVGAWMHARRLPGETIAVLARSVAAAALGYGGLLFAGWGTLALAVPRLAGRLDEGIATGIPARGLDHAGAGMALVAFVLAIVAVSFRRSLRRLAGAAPVRARPDETAVAASAELGCEAC